MHLNPRDELSIALGKFFNDHDQILLHIVEESLIMVITECMRAAPTCEDDWNPVDEEECP